MFGEKSREIARLGQLVALKDRTMGEVIDSRNYLVEANNELAAQIDQLKKDLASNDLSRVNWMENFKDLNARYTLLDSVLKQLSINITLPAKKNARPDKTK